MPSELEGYLSEIERLVRQGGPRPEEDEAVTVLIAQIQAEFEKQALGEEDRQRMWSALKFTPDTMQGFAFLKPNGYPGCYEIIERIYNRYHCAAAEHFNWDRYWQKNPAAEAVRNRKEYFIRLIMDLVGRQGPVAVLNVASGPCRDVFDLFQACPNLPATFFCVEHEEQAIEFAKALCREHLAKIEFFRHSALRFTTDQRFDLVWSAGLFDYLSDKLFVHLTERLATFAKPGGELVIGNFVDTNPSRPYMELFDWRLEHRSAEQLLELAREAGLEHPRNEVRSEPAGVNLFLHVRIPER